MLVNFHCYTCDESFNVRDKYLIEKNRVVCPNCSTAYPDESFQHLKSAVHLILQSRSALKNEDTPVGYTPLFRFKIEEGR